MIVGVGLDIVELERLARLLDGPSGRRFVERVLTDREREGRAEWTSRRSLEYIGGRFAAKEAVVKALGCGIGAVAGFRDIEVLPDASGKPVCSLSESTVRKLGWEGQFFRVHLAITHERKLAAATALVEK